MYVFLISVTVSYSLRGVMGAAAASIVSAVSPSANSNTPTRGDVIGGGQNNNNNTTGSGNTNVVAQADHAVAMRTSLLRASMPSPTSGTELDHTNTTKHITSHYITLHPSNNPISSSSVPHYAYTLLTPHLPLFLRLSLHFSGDCDWCSQYFDRPSHQCSARGRRRHRVRGGVRDGRGVAVCFSEDTTGRVDDRRCMEKDVW